MASPIAIGGFVEAGSHNGTNSSAAPPSEVFSEARAVAELPSQ